MSSVIQVENLSKAYQIGEFSTGTLSQDVERWWLRMRGKEDRFLKLGETNERTKTAEGNLVWSLKDVNFSITEGEAVGIIGRNGAGKSTLLKLLSRVTSPTIGSIKVKGRIASLLEVGTGFHPELTGRENIFLNGAILGMRKNEIKRKFDEIVEFSGVQRYIDTPVKRYSSGMYVRLAFAVAAHLESEILIVDEVLAVGDAEFQKKCLGKMNDVSKGEGRTVLFVSHNMAAIKNLCTKGMLLTNGELDFNGSVEGCFNSYLIDNKQDKFLTNLEDIVNRSGNGKVIFSAFHVENDQGQAIEHVLTGETIALVFKLKVNDTKVNKINVGFSLHNMHDDLQSYLYSGFQEQFFNSSDIGYITVRCYLQDFPFTQGRLVVKGRILLGDNESDWPKENLGVINIETGDFYKTGKTTEIKAPVLIKGIWE